MMDMMGFEIETGLNALAEARDNPSHTVRITAFACAAKMVLVPTFPAFMLANPDVPVEVNIDECLTCIVDAGSDARIRLAKRSKKT